MGITGYYPNYFTLEDISVTQDRVSCISNRSLSGMGFLDSSSDKESLEVGKKINAPLWYALQFSIGRSPYLSVQIPDIYRRISKEMCEADATSVNLGLMNKNFYEFGRYIIRLDHLGNVGPLLHETSRQRCRHIMDLCKENDNDGHIKTKLDDLEMSLYVAGSKTHAAFSKWLSNDTNSLEIAAMIMNHQKRKRNVLEFDEINCGQMKRMRN